MRHPHDFNPHDEHPRRHRAAPEGEADFRGGPHGGPHTRGAGRGRPDGGGTGRGGRGGRGRGPAGFGGGFGPGEFGPIDALDAMRNLRDFGGRRGPGRGRRGDVRKAVLAVLTDGPANGYQLMETIAQRSHGLWRPSPGSVYPALNLLEDEGLIEAVQQDGRKAYGLTEAGRAHVAEHGVDAPWEEVSQPHQGFLDVRAEAKSLLLTLHQVAATGDDEQRRQARAVLDRARRDLHRIMAGDLVTDEPDPAPAATAAPETAAPETAAPATDDGGAQS